MADSTTTQTTFLDYSYIRGIPAFMKAGEAIFSIIAFICVTVATTKCGIADATSAYFEFASITAFIVAVILWVFGLLKLQQRIFRCDCLRIPLVLFVIYIVVVILLFFGDLFLAIGSCSGAHKAGCAFGFFALFVFMVDIFLSFRIWRSERHESHQQSTTTTSSPIDPSDPRY